MCLKNNKKMTVSFLYRPFSVAVFFRVVEHAVLFYFLFFFENPLSRASRTPLKAHFLPQIGAEKTVYFNYGLSLASSLAMSVLVRCFLFHRNIDRLNIDHYILF